MNKERKIKVLIMKFLLFIILSYANRAWIASLSLAMTITDIP